MTKPIPTRLLIHECVLKKPTGLDRNRNPIYESMILKQVRIGATVQEVRGSYGAVKADTLTLFIDAKNTRFETEGGEAIERKPIVPKDVIEWQGQTFTVRSVMPCYTQGNSPHHWEVLLE